MPERFTITIGLPHKCLSPNARAHWGLISVEKKRLREAVYNTIKLIHPKVAELRWQAATIEYDFYHETNRVRDDDNYIAMMKAGRDALGRPVSTGRKVVPGLGIVPDDSCITQGKVRHHIDKDNPRVEITLQRIKEDQH